MGNTYSPTPRTNANRELALGTERVRADSSTMDHSFTRTTYLGHRNDYLYEERNKRGDYLLSVQQARAYDYRYKDLAPRSLLSSWSKCIALLVSLLTICEIAVTVFVVALIVFQVYGPLLQPV